MVFSNLPYFSIVIPIYNEEKYLRDCLQSVVDQCFSDFEVLMINDGSQDSSATICKQFTEIDPRFKLIEQKNRGLSGARNTGIRHAIGKYIAFLDSDDLWHPDKLKAHYYLHQLHPDISMSYSQSELINMDNSLINIQQQPKITNISISDIYCRNPVGNGSSAVIKNKILKEIGFHQQHSHQELQFFDESLIQSEDIECWIRLYTKTDLKIEGIPFPLTMYRVNNQGLSSDYKKQLKNWFKMTDKIYIYNPELVKQNKNKALAYQFRYISRWAIIKKQKSESIYYITQALRTHPQMMIEEPVRTIITLGSSILLITLPKKIFKWLFIFVQQKLGHHLQRQSH
ncbi:glycosyltransferase family 2 protein [Photobacterium aquimaris]|uniref:Putative glycosyltransferase EpsH n=1 Tax=Photobacterium aquimaris TaxID=512643 RepID=A0A1Y6L1B6_9GAMM|nr:glycosyltransferase family 2 protein [Photobacterium aquimaris]SMY16428.1 Putative glycosyltransferase EpsH [Photobacterium aquimaris]